MDRTLRYAMIGGGHGAFIGSVHRIAAGLDSGAQLVAGALSSSPQRALDSARELGLDPARSHPTWQAMLDDELRRPPSDRIDFVSIVTPNHAHFEPAHAFASAGFHVVLDKPMVHTSAQADALARAVEERKTVFAVTYNYSGYPMVKQARHMVLSGVIGTVRKVVAVYNQGWLATRLESSGQKQADWRTDPARSGLGGAIGDIGSHAEQLTRYVTGLEIDSLCADLTTFVEGRRLDDDASVLLRFRGPAAQPAPRGILAASQIQVGHENDLRIRVHGTLGSLEWRQEDPNQLVHRPLNEPERILRRGNAYLCDAAKAASRIPPGHPEAFLEAFANVYQNAMTAIRSGAGGIRAAADFDFPGVLDGASGVRFIEKTVESSRSEKKWTSIA